MRWFRQNDKTTKYIYIGVTVFVMFTFSITGAMIHGLQNDDSKDVAGTFRLPSGETVEITKSKLAEQQRRFARVSRNRLEDEDIWQLVMMDSLARDAGIVVSNEMLRRSMSQQFGSQAQIDRVLESISLSRADFNELTRDQIRIQLYQQLTADQTRILGGEVFEKFQADNELFQLDYVAYRDAVEREALDAETPSDEDLQAYYDDDLDEFTKNTDYATEERFKLEALVLELENKTVDELKSMVREISKEVTEADLQATYGRLKDHRFKLDEDPAKEESEEEANKDGSEEEDGSEDGSEVEVDPDAGYQPLDEVRDDVTKIVLGTRVIAEARQEYYLKVGERRNLQAEKDAADNAPADDASDGDGTDDPPADGAPPAEDPKEEIVVPSLQEVIDGVASKFSLVQMDYADPVTTEEMKDLDRIGADDLSPLVTSMQTEGARSRDSSASVEQPYLLVCEERIARTPKAFADVKEDLIEPWREHNAKNRAQEKGDAFLAALQAAARPKVEDGVAKIEAEAKEAADKQIEDKAVTDEAEQEKIREDQLALRQSEIDVLLAPHYGEVFADVVASQGATIETTEWFRKSYSGTDFYRDGDDTAEKFLMRAGNFEKEIGEVAGPLRDDTSGSTIFAQVKDRKLPEFKDMGLGDRQSAEMSVLRDKDPEFMQRMMAMYNPQAGGFTPSQFTYATLKLQLGLDIAEPEEEAAPQQ